MDIPDLDYFLARRKADSFAAALCASATEHVIISRRAEPLSTICSTLN
jgi:hypothetical protein